MLAQMGTHMSALVLLVVFAALFILALIALLRCRSEDIPAVIKALASWWKIWFRT